MSPVLQHYPPHCAPVIAQSTTTKKKLLPLLLLAHPCFFPSLFRSLSLSVFFLFSNSLCLLLSAGYTHTHVCAHTLAARSLLSLLCEKRSVGSWALWREGLLSTGWDVTALARGSPATIGAFHRAGRVFSPRAFLSLSADAGC